MTKSILEDPQSLNTSGSGLLIAFEGGEGSGKTTLIASIKHALEKLQRPCISVREPGGTALGDAIRGLLLNKELPLNICSKAELCLFLAARAQNINDNIGPELKRGKIVLSDRFNASTIAYQGIARGLGIEEVSIFCNFICGPVIPDVTIYLDIDPKVGLERSSKLDKEHATIGTSDRIESENLAFHTAVRAGFKMISNKLGDSFLTIDATLPKEEVFNTAWNDLLRRFRF